MKVSRRQDVPTRAVRLEVLALALEHASADFRSGWVISARVGDILNAAQRHVGCDEVRVAADESGPLLILGHGNGTAAQTLDSLVGIVAFTLEDTSKSVVSLLNFANNDRLELAAGGFEVEVSLVTSVGVHAILQGNSVLRLTLWR